MGAMSGAEKRRVLTTQGHEGSPEKHEAKTHNSKLNKGRSPCFNWRRVQSYRSSFLLLYEVVVVLVLTGEGFKV